MIPRETMSSALKLAHGAVTSATGAEVTPSALDWDLLADRVLGHVYEIEKERLKEDPEENPVIVLAALRLLEDRFKGSIDCDEHFRTRLLRYADTVKPSSYKLPRTI